MGSFTSKAFDDLMEDIPSTPVAGKRVLTFDPRSPSSGISRTPIQVEKTPDRLLDPRSPTCGILRTPILNCEEERRLACRARSSPVRQRSHSFSEGSPTHIEELSMKDALDSLPPLDLDVSESGDCLQLIKRSSSEPELVPVDLPKEKPQKAVSKTPEKNVRQRKPKALFQGNINITDMYMDAPRSPLRTISDAHQRSPLSKRVNKDVNSPLSIVQRKQSNKLGMLKSRGSTPVKSAGNSPCRFEAMTAEDKENISM